MNPTLTRFRVQTVPPLEPLKFWHTISSESGFQCINDLAQSIIIALGLSTATHEVVLELDGFILLPSSPVGAVRDGDIITVKCKNPVEKRKASEEGRTESNTSQNPHKKRKTRSPSSSTASSVVSFPVSAPIVPEIPPTRASLSLNKVPPHPSKLASSGDDTSSTSSETSSDTSSDDSDSDSDSSSESSSGSSSDSDSDGGPIPQPIIRGADPTLGQPVKTQKPPVNPQITRPQQPPVPPGEGKQSTKNRNARRRLFRKHQAAGTTPSHQPSPVPIVPQAPTPDTDQTSTTTRVKPDAPIAPAKNANKNKKKGFDSDMSGVVSTRIVFGTPAPASTSSLGPTQPSRADSPLQPPIKTNVTKSRYTHYHVVPPSQRKDLPSNVIVTSVDVEAMDGMEGVGEWFDGETRALEENAVDGKPQNEPARTNNNIDWDDVDTKWEQSWDSFPIVGVEGWKSLKVGTTLAWKALTIDPLTCTPCMKIHLARVTASPSSTSVECFVVDRPGSGDVGFGFGGPPVSDEMEEESGEMTGENRAVDAEEVKQWRIVV